LRLAREIMLTIRSEQMRALGNSVQREFERRLLNHLRLSFPAQTRGRSEEELLQLIRLSITGARGYDVITERDVTRYVEYALMYGSQFDEELPWARAILRTNGISGTLKMDRIDDYDLFSGKGQR
jgi:hypothetical protein